eukprot:TRINITY_DN5994_c0_g1_i3.p1 TRINITY_DN5994_c0_g1~~TRINITY_DN5994_c0_g1_i3.p1  ORF type:complete len:190 (+),score=34.44 TRINITY_DN5994_c0_g1_i3:202-771(+)
MRSGITQSYLQKTAITISYIDKDDHSSLNKWLEEMDGKLGFSAVDSSIHTGNSGFCRTLLTYSVAYSRDNCTRLLISKRANVNLKDSAAYPLDYAEREEIAELLFRHGAYKVNWLRSNPRGRNWILFFVGREREECLKRIVLVKGLLVIDDCCFLVAEVLVRNFVKFVSRMTEDDTNAFSLALSFQSGK